MKIKRFLAGLLALSMMFSTGNITNVSAAETTGSSEEGLLASGLTEGTYTDENAEADTEYEYTVVGSDGSTDTVSTDLMDVAEKVYVRYTGTAMPPAGNYVITTAITAKYSAIGNTRVNNDENEKLSLTQLELYPTYDVIRNVTDAQYVWEFAQSGDNYTIKNTGNGLFMYIDGNSVANGLQFSTDESDSVWKIVQGTIVDDEIVRSWALGNGTGYIDSYNYQGVGTWTSSTGDNNQFYLYREQYAVQEEQITALTIDVDNEIYYSSESWAAYETALSEAKDYYETEEEAYAAYQALEAAKEALTPMIWKDVVEPCYVKVTSLGTEPQMLTDGTYLIVGAHYDSGYPQEANFSKNKVVSSVDLDYLKVDEPTVDLNEISNSHFTSKNYQSGDFEWEIVYDTTNSSYKFLSSGGDYLYIDAENAAEGAALYDNEVLLNIVTPDSGGYANAVCIGGINTNSDESLGYLNHRNNKLGTWTGKGTGSNYYFYEKMTVVSADKIAEAQDGLAETDYTAESWAIYQAALTKAEGKFDSAEEAYIAYTELLDSINALVKTVADGYVAEAYERVTPERQTEDTDIVIGKAVSDGRYIIAGAANNKALNSDDTISYTYIGNLLTADGKINSIDTTYEWRFVWSGTGYMISATDAEGAYLMITDEDSPTGVTTGTAIQMMNLAYLNGKDNAYPNSVHIGGIDTDADAYLGYLNNRTQGTADTSDGAAGTWDGHNYGGFPDDGSSYYLYERVFTVEETKVTEVTTDVGAETDYTTDSWAVYEEALKKVDGGFNTADEAYAAYQELVAATEGLAEANYSYTMKELYDAICAANGGEFLFSEEVYTSDSGKAYRDALEAARGTFTTEAEKVQALENLVDAVEALELNTGMKSVFPDMTWTVTAETDSDETTTGKNYIQDLVYTNTEVYDPDTSDTDGVTFAANEALTWNWESIARLVNDDDEKTDPVWTKNELGLSHRVFSHSVLDDNAYEKADVYKISGSFKWPEGYDLANTTVVLDSVNDFYYRDVYEYIDGQDLGDYFPLGQVLPVNDDVYVVLWAEQDGETKPTVDDINNHLAFWAGTSGKGVWSEYGNINNDWGRTETATFLEWNLQGERTFRNSYPNIIGTTAIEDTNDAKTAANAGVKPWTFEYLQHTDGWYTLTDTSAVNSVLRDNYPNGITAGTTVHVDLYVMNNSGQGIIDEFEIELYTTEDPDVQVNYYLNGVSEDTLLGTEYMLNVPVGTEVTLMPGVRAGQLNSYKAEAIYKAGYKDVTDGVQVNELTVTESGDNVVNVVYTVKDAKIVYLTAESGNYIWDGTEYTLKNVTITEDGVTGEVTLENEEDGIYKLPDGNYIYGVFASVSAADPGYYDNLFINKDQIVVKSRVEREDPTTGNIITTETVLTNYVIITTPGKLTITYEPEAVTKTYDFGVENVYTDVLEDVELKADFGEVEDHVAISNTSKDISYTPVAANTGEIVELELGFAGGYTVTKELTFLPATNVLYEDNFVTEKPNKVTDEETGEERDETAAEIEADAAWTVATANARTVADNEGTVYGYSAAYDNDFAHSNDTAMMAELVLNGNYVETERAATFSFTGTGFDLISACGTNTGMLLVQVTNATEAGKAKFYLVDTYFTGDETLITGDGILDYQVPVIREMDLPYGEHEVNVWGYLVNTTGAGAATYGMSRMSVTTDDIIMAALDCAGVLEEVDVADVEVSFIDENSSLNGGTGNVTGSGVSTFALTDETETTAETTATTAYVYIDGFRVYGALEAETSYVENEQGLKYVSVYDYAQNSAGDMAEDEWVYDSLLYVEYDGEVDVASIAQYKNQGPQNEVYLTSTDEVSSAIGFVLENYTEGMTVMVSAKAVSDGAILGVMNKDFEFEALRDSLSATEMYYDISNYIVEYETGKYMVAFNNSGTGVLSVSELKLDKDINAAAAAEAGAVVEKALEDSNTEYAFVPARFEVSYNDIVQSGRTTSISVKTSLPVDGEPENTVEKVKLLDENGELVKEFKLSNKAAVTRGKASYCSYSASVKVTENVTYQAVAYNENGEASAPLEITINVQ